MQAVILAAGRGDRLKPLTHYRPKAMLPVLGKPMVQLVMEQIEVPEIGELILVVNPEDQCIRNYFKSLSFSNKDIKLAFQQKPFGTANALFCASPLINEGFLLTSCDNLTSQEYIIKMLAAWKSAPELNAILTLKYIDLENPGSMAIVTLDNFLITSITEKPEANEVLSNIASLPLYCFNLSILDFLNDLHLSKRNEFELQDAINGLISERGAVEGMWIDHRFHLTTPEDLLRINLEFFCDEGFKSQVLSNRVDARTKIITPVLIETGSIIGSDCRIGPKVYIEHGCRIGSGSEIQNAVILEPSQIRPGSVIKNRIHILE